MDIREKYKNARAFIVLLAALITWLLNMKYERSMVKSLIILLIVIIVFYMIATIALKLVDKIRNMDTAKQVDIIPVSHEEETGETKEDAQ